MTNIHMKWLIFQSKNLIPYIKAVSSGTAFFYLS